MCLYRVDKCPKVNLEQGWKLFHPRTEKSVSGFYRSTALVRYTHQGTKRGGRLRRSLPLGTWIEDMNVRDLTSYDQDFTKDTQYPTGFHIIVDSVSNIRRNWNDSIVEHKLHRVFFRNVVASGIDQTLRTVVAKEMFICPNTPEWLDNLPSYMI